jgi:hypothetical protein
MKAIIYHVNAKRGMYSAKLSNGYFTVFELIDPIQLNRSAEVMGEFEAVGEREVAMNEHKLHIHIDNYGLNEIIAFQKTFLIA